MCRVPFLRIPAETVSRDGVLQEVLKGRTTGRTILRIGRIPRLLPPRLPLLQSLFGEVEMVEYMLVTFLMDCSAYLTQL